MPWVRAGLSQAAASLDTPLLWKQVPGYRIIRCPWLSRCIEELTPTARERLGSCRARGRSYWCRCSGGGIATGVLALNSRQGECAQGKGRRGNDCGLHGVVEGRLVSN